MYESPLKGKYKNIKEAFDSKENQVIRKRMLSGEMFNRHTIDELGFEKVEQQSSNWFTDMTTKRAFMELDGM
jgi:ribosomal protein S2